MLVPGAPTCSAAGRTGTTSQVRDRMSEVAVDGVLTRQLPWLTTLQHLEVANVQMTKKMEKGRKDLLVNPGPKEVGRTATTASGLEKACNCASCK